eukprot:TRINITY_DN71999_c0_g1_i1.p2 TRINITY_DN71999_c0_g1~~TRINITY_DN71999_c0_g1_i1.p2  ORF type:complete len:272 (-),score=109.24 TRINITY_DN71999_c0_g1_i1:6-821(-)
MANAEDASTLEVVNAQPLLASARRSKEEGNGLVKRKMLSEAVRCYESGLATLDKADGAAILRQEVEEMLTLKATLYGNMAQCLLGLELYRRAAEAASAALRIDADNAKAVYRRMSAYEALRNWPEALKDALELKKLGGGSLSAEALDKRIEEFRSKKEGEERERAQQQAEDEEDEDGMEMVRCKERFDAVVEKYDLSNAEAAAEVADWLTSGEWEVTVKRVADRFRMDAVDATHFLAWIARGLEFKAQTGENAAKMMGSSPGVPNMDPSAD